MGLVRLHVALISDRGRFEGHSPNHESTFGARSILRICKIAKSLFSPQIDSSVRHCVFWLGYTSFWNINALVSLVFLGEHCQGAFTFLRVFLLGAVGGNWLESGINEVF